MFVKARDVTYFWRGKRRLSSAEARDTYKGLWHAPQEAFRKEHSKTLFPAFLETKYQFSPCQYCPLYCFDCHGRVLSEML